MIIFTFTFLFSGKIRKFRIELKKLPVETLAISTLQRFTTAIFGYFISHVIGLKFVFDNALYVRLRLAYESKFKYNREDVNELLDEYPFRHKTDFLFSDLQIRNNISKFDGDDNKEQKIDLKANKKKGNWLLIKEKEKD